MLQETESSPPNGPQQSRPGLVVEGDDEAGSWQVCIIAYRGAPATQKSRSMSQTLSTSSCWGNMSTASRGEEN